MIRVLNSTVAGVGAIRADALPACSESDFDPLLDLVGDARFVLLGEATHGTHEFYAARAMLTRRLIEEKGFCAVAVEADWPDACRVSRFIRGLGDDRDADEALGDFECFPAWMWRNAEVAEFVSWLREHNAELARDERVGFFGLDMYSLRGSMAAVIDYLEKVDPEAASRARKRYARFDQFTTDPHRQRHAAGLGISRSCEDEVVAQLVDLLQSRSRNLSRDGLPAEDEQFSAEQNARLVRNAEEYYRRLYHGTTSSWNLRDRHMFDTLQAVSEHLHRIWPRPKIVVWEHNSHLGDARATSMADRGELNVGQLVRQVHRQDAVLIGFTTFDGTVAAATEWDGPLEIKRIRPAHPESYEAFFHEAELPEFMLLMREPGDAVDSLVLPRLERAIGVIYRPETELVSHYFRASLPAQFDAVIHYDRTTAIEPLDAEPVERGEFAETFPTGL